MWKRRLREPGKQFRDLKYKALGIDRRPKGFYVNEFPKKSWEEADTLHYLRQTRALAQSIITDLSDMTDLSQLPLRMPDIRSKWAHLDSSLVKYSANGLPLIETPHSPASVLRELTAYKYSPQETDAITQWICKLLGAPQPHLQSQMSTESFNYLVGFALNLNDIHLASYIVEIMKSDHHTWPNRTTLHLFLDFNAALMTANPYPRPMLGHPLINTQLCIRRMKALGVKADHLTWNLVMRCMPFGFGKSFLVEEMDKRGIPLEDSAKRALFETIINDRKEGDVGKLRELVDLQDPTILRLLIDHTLGHKTSNNANVQRAWDLLRTKSHDTSQDMMHIFLRRFAARKHLDWQFGIMGFFRDTPWDPETWQYFIEAASFMSNDNNSNAKPVILGTLLKQAERENVPLTVRSRYLARRACKASLRDIGADGWHELKEGLVWEENEFRPRRPELLYTIGFSKDGYEIPSEPVKALDDSRFSAMPRTDTFIRRSELSRQLGDGQTSSLGANCT